MDAENFHAAKLPWERHSYGNPMGNVFTTNTVKTIRVITLVCYVLILRGH